MMWLCWRQMRTQLIWLFGALLVLALIVVVTGLDLRHVYDSSGIGTCVSTQDCDTRNSLFTDHFRFLQPVLDRILVLLLPGLLGVFWGAPLVAREMESGTYRLVWTQSVTRARWIATKLAFVVAASILASGLLTAMVTWWFGPLDRVDHNRFLTPEFDTRNLVPVAYTVFAVSLGLTVGAVLRRTLPAMATTLVGFVAVRMVVANWARPYYRSPLHVTGPMAKMSDTPRLPGGAQPGDWIVSNTTYDPSGHVTHGIRVQVDDPCIATRTCLDGYTHRMMFQPADRYWSFQFIESGLFLLLALVLLAAGAWWVVRRLR